MSLTAKCGCPVNEIRSGNQISQSFGGHVEGCKLEVPPKPVAKASTRSTTKKTTKGG